MSKVRLLDPVTANQIAAGEVVERPAAALKELVENSIDAGGLKIDVEIRSGGRELIKVSDNGSGMDREDALLCLERHATSKLRGSEDLQRVVTLGFRGEALPSIAGVSRFQLNTWDGQGDAGTEVVLEGGILKKSGPVAMGRGTTVWVRDLFFNVPARYKFMKGTPAEARACLETLGNIAMAHPEVSIRMVSDGKELLNTTGSGDLLEVIGKVMGKEIAKEMIPLESGDSKLGVMGFVSGPHYARASRSSQAFFLNGRFIRGRMMVSAVERAFERVIPAGRFPAAVIKLEIDPSSVDVNVHPAKIEVKFEDESEIFKLIHRAVNKALASPGIILGGHAPESGQPVRMVYEPMGDQGERHIQDRLSLDLEGSGGSEGMPSVNAHPTDVREASVEKNGSGMKSIDLGGSTYRIERPGGWGQPKSGPSRGGQEHPRTLPEQPRPRPFTILGQVLETYIICGDRQGVVLVDQHNSHERVIYEGLKNRLSGKDSSAPPVQGMLVPMQFRLAKDEYGILQENSEILERMGYTLSIKPDGDGAIVEITSMPVHFGGVSGADGFDEALSQLASSMENGDGDSSDATSREEKLMISLSCRSAIKAGKKLELREMEALVDALLATDRPFTCPHGRPTFIRFNEEEIEKRLGRR